MSIENKKTKKVNTGGILRAFAASIPFFLSQPASATEERNTEVKSEKTITKVRHNESVSSLKDSEISRREKQSSIDEHELLESEEDNIEKELDLADSEDANKRWREGTTVTETVNDIEKDYSDFLKEIKGHESVIKFLSLPKVPPNAGYINFRKENLEMCRKIEKYCELLNIAEKPKQRIELTPTILRTLNMVNDYVNKTISEVDDEKGKDIWSIDMPEKGGDCDDKMISKLKKILEMNDIQHLGLLPEMFSFTIVTKKRFVDGIDVGGDGHALLTFHTIVKGIDVDLILDNIMKEILTPSQTNYNFFYATGPLGMQEIEIRVRKQ